MKKYCYTCMEEIRQGNYCISCMKENEPEYSDHYIKVGTILRGRYLVGNCLEENDFCITYIARDLTLDVKVAIKEYYPHGYVKRGSDLVQMIAATETHNEIFATGKERFLQEAKSVAKFSEEPGIVNVWEYFEENNTAYIVIGYLDGEKLESRLSKQGPYDVGTIFQLFLPVAESLQKIHDAGIIHRNITPDNIIYRSNGTLTLMNFGAANNYWGEDNEQSESIKQRYAPEEQLLTKGMLGPWTDVYSLCATIYRCITGVVPECSLDRVKMDQLKKPSDLGIEISAPLENVLMHGLEVYRENRFQSMKELTDSIRRAISKQEDQLPTRKAKPADDGNYKTQAAEEYYRSKAADDVAPEHKSSNNYTKTCPRCKAKIRLEDRYCTNCGYDFQRGKRRGNWLLYIILGLVLILLAITSALFFGGRNTEKNTGNESASENKMAEEAVTQEPTDSAVQPTSASESAEPTSPAVSMGFVAEVLTSSFLDSQYGNTYYPYNAVDSDVNSAWVEGVEGQGVGETLTIRFDRRSVVSGIVIYSGYQKSSSLFYKNSRPETILISFSDGESETITLRDTLGSQHIVFSSPVETSEVVLTIRSVFPGSTYTDTAISEISLF